MSRRLDRSTDADVVDVYFAADVETDGPIPGPYSMLSFALVEIGRFDGQAFSPATPRAQRHYYAELRPISDDFQAEAMAVNGLDRQALIATGRDPTVAMTEAAAWVAKVSSGGIPVLVAYPLSFDWSWLYWYFTRFARGGSPFNHSRCYDLKTAFAVKAGRPVAASGRDQLIAELGSTAPHTHNALDDAREISEIFVKLFDWRAGHRGG